MKSSDNVSQKLCNKCLNITVKMFKFRSSSIINDMELKSKAARKLNPVLNKSVEVLLKKYPNIVLPSSITKNNISPVVKINKNEIFNGKSNRVKKAGRNIKQPLKSATKLAIQGEMSEVLDLENRITPYVIQNKEIPVRPQLSKSTEATPQNLVTKTLSPDMSKLTSEIDEQQKLPQEDNSSSSNDEIVSNSIMTAENRNNKTKRNSSVSPNSKKPKRFKSDTDSLNEDDSVESLVTLKYVTKSLSICDICNGILYNAKDLKKHKMNHMKCHLCKNRFRSLEETKKHSESGCTIKKIISNLPTIILERCDQSKELRKKYPLLIGGFNKTIEVKVGSLSSKPNQPEEPSMNYHEVETVKVEQAASSSDVKLEPETVAESSLIPNDENEIDKSPNNRDVYQISCKSEMSESIFISPENDINNPLMDSSKSTIDNSIEKKTTESQILSIVSIKPDISIIGENILDVNLDDTETNLLRNILKRTKNPLKDTCVQTDTPSNADILPCSNKDKSFVLKNFNKFLSFHKIPVNLCFAHQYSVKFIFEPSRTLEKNISWSKIIPKITASSKTLPLNDVHQKNTLNNSTPYELINNSSPEGLSSRFSVQKSVSLIIPILDVQSTTDKQSGIGNLRRESTCGVATSLLPTILHTTASNFSQSNNTFGIARPPIVSTCYVMNRNPCSKTEVQLHQKNVNFNLLDHSILSQVLANPMSRQNYGVQNTYSPSNITVSKTATGAPSMNNIPISQIIHMPSNAYTRPLFGVRNITTDGLNATSSIKNVLGPPLTSVNKSTTAHSEVASSTQTQKSDALSPTTITSDPENHSGSNFPPAIKVKDVSELR